MNIKNFGPPHLYPPPKEYGKVHGFFGHVKTTRFLHGQLPMFFSLKNDVLLIGYTNIDE